MSRIEEAMEKANQMRGAAVLPADGGESVSEADDLGNAPVIPGRQESSASTSGPYSKQSSIEKLHIDNPLLVASSNYSLPIAEEYRKLKSIIVQITKREGFQNTLMVTSAIGSEGKSLTALNLAICLAQEHDHHVLLVDSDLRNPSICRYLGLEPKVGLAHCLMDNLDIGDCLIKTGLGNLTILPAGKRVANPVELFSSQRMKELLDEIKHRYNDRYIVFDTSPVLPFAEARVIGNIVDGVVFVIKEGGTSMFNIKEALNSLGDAHILGLVYNNATTASLDGGYHYYYYDYASKPRNLIMPPAGKGWKSGIISKFLKRKSDS